MPFCPNFSFFLLHFNEIVSFDTFSFWFLFVCLFEFNLSDLIYFSNVFDVIITSFLAANQMRKKKRNFKEKIVGKKKWDLLFHKVHWFNLSSLVIRQLSQIYSIHKIITMSVLLSGAKEIVYRLYFVTIRLILMRKRNEIACVEFFIFCGFTQFTHASSLYCCLITKINTFHKSRIFAFVVSHA